MISIAHVERLIAELASRGHRHEDLQDSWQQALIAGYGRALTLEGEPRRLRERQLELAGLPQPDAQTLSELTGSVQREARLDRRERELRTVLGRLEGAPQPT